MAHLSLRSVEAVEPKKWCVKFILTVYAQQDYELKTGPFNPKPTAPVIELFRYLCYREASAFQDCLACRECQDRWDLKDFLVSAASQEKMVMMERVDPKARG